MGGALLTAHASWLLDLRGVQSHHRSLLVWPDLLETAGRVALRQLVYTGARIIALEQPLRPQDVTSAPAPVRLGLWANDPLDSDPSAGGDPAGPGCGGSAPRTSSADAVDTRDTDGVPSARLWQEMVALWQAAGITPLPPSARNDPAWRHAPARDADGLLRTASLQKLTAPVGPQRAMALVCAVATRPSMLRRGHSRAAVAALTGGGIRAVALIEPNSGSDGFFARAGWRPIGSAFLYHHR